MTSILLWAAALAAAPAPTRHVRADLVSEVESVRAGTPFAVGLLLRMSPGWHTYWRNPGDSGLATRLVWTLPEGFHAGPIEWPYPRTFSQGPVTSYGYEGEVLLGVAITPPASLPAGAHVSLGARVDWLECREACLPGRAELTLVLPVRSEPSAPAPAWAGAFAEARRRLPGDGRGWTLFARETADRWVLVIRPPRAEGPLRTAYFFPERGQVLEHAAPQKLARGRDSYRLELLPAPNAPRGELLTGVLVVETAGGRTAAVRVDATIDGRGGKPAASASTAPRP